MSVCMPVMNIRVMRVPMHKRAMLMPMAMRFTRRRIRPVGVLMVFVMNMPVFMFQRRVRMFVLVALRQMYPKAHCHKGARRDKPDRQRLMEQHQRKHRADERRQ